MHYFSLTYPLGERWYLSPAQDASGGNPPQARRTPGRRRRPPTFDPAFPGRVHACDPRMKLIVVLQDPVERAYSLLPDGTGDA